MRNPQWWWLIPVYVLFALWLTLPLCFGLNCFLPVGTQPAATVPLFNLWTLRWNAESLQGGLTNYWNAPSFAPEKATFTFSDPQPLSGLVYCAVFRVTGAPVLTYNLLLITVLALNGLSAYYLLRRRCSVPAPAAISAGLLAESLPFVFNELGVFQMTVLFPILMTLGALRRFADTGTLKAALALGAWTSATYLTSGYYGVFESVFLLLGGAVLVRRGLLRLRPFSNLLAGTGLATVVLAPVVVAQLRSISALKWEAEYVQRLSAQPPDYLRLDDRMWGCEKAPWLLPEEEYRWSLYPGTGLLGLAIVGLAAGGCGPERRWILYCLCGAALAWLLSLGMNWEVGGWRPYSLLRDSYPGVDKLRSPYRLAVFLQVFLVILAGYGLAALGRWRGRAGSWLAVVAVVLSLVEVWAVPVRVYATQPALAEGEWINWLRERPPSLVAMVPFAETVTEEAHEGTVVAMLQAIEHGQPVVNGYSGFYPPSYLQLIDLMRSFPDQKSLAALWQTGVTYVVVDREWLTAERLLELQAWREPLEPVFADRQKSIYRLLEVTCP